MVERKNSMCADGRIRIPSVSALTKPHMRCGCRGVILLNVRFDHEQSKIDWDHRTGGTARRFRSASVPTDERRSDASPGSAGWFLAMGSIGGRSMDSKRLPENVEPPSIERG